MKIKYIFLVIGLFIGSETFANDQFDFINDCLEVFAKLDKAIAEFNLTLANNTDSDKLKAAITEYNNELVLFSMNKLLKHSKSGHQNIQEVATDLRNLITDLIKIRCLC